MEIWKDLIYQGINYGYKYEISTYGNIKNKFTGYIYSVRKLNTGYYGTTLKISSRCKRVVFRVHRAVAETFIPNPDNKPEVNHIDGNKQNNTIDNLEWVTKSENMQHAVKNNLIDFAKISGENNVNHKLTVNDVLFIRRYYTPRHNEFGCRALAKKFGVHHKTITQIIKNKTWKI